MKFKPKRGILWILLPLNILFYHTPLHAQFIGPNPVPVHTGTPETFQDSLLNGNTYLWTFESTPIDFSLNAMPATGIAASGSSLDEPVFVATVNNNGQWFSFVSNYSSHEIIRLAYGSSPLNNPTATNLGTFGSGDQLEGVEIIRDTNGVWFGFAVNSSELIRWQFDGDSLSGNPINITDMSFPSNLKWAHQINIKWFSQLNKFIGFVANRNGSITRLDFGNSVANTPTLTNLPTANSFSACNFVLYDQKGDWYMLTTNLLDNTISRIDFGSNVQSNNPTVTNLGNLGGLLNLPRGIVLFPNCNPDQLIGYALNEDGAFFKLDFNSDITNMPTITNLGTLSDTRNCISTFLYNNEIYCMTQNSSSNQIQRIHLLTIPTPNDIQYAAAAASHTYAAPNTYTATLYTDPGGLMGASVGCKSFEVTRDSTKEGLIEPLTTHSESTLFQNTPNPFNDETKISFYINWQNVTTASISIVDILGRKMHTYPIKANASGNQNITVSKNTLVPGAYYYSLVIDGYKIETRKMIVVE